MENAEISINANAIGGFCGMDAFKKVLSVDQSEVDSGFAENWSISHHSSAAASISGLSNSAKLSTSSFKKSSDLETIPESVDLKDLQETPTTRNIRHLKSFHIQTPQNARNQQETTPTKANYFSNLYDSGLRSSTKKNQSGIRWSSNKSSPKLRSMQRLKSFSAQKTLFESIDEDYENMFNADDTNVCNQSVGVSPIKPHDISDTIEQQTDKVQGIQRHSSGIDSSTPKTNIRRIRTQSIVKPKANISGNILRDRIVRKAQSFSPAKRSALRESNFQHSINPEDVLEEEDESPIYNPAQKVLAFNPEKFDQLIQMGSPTTLQQTPKKLNKAENRKDETPTKQMPVKRLDKSRSRFVKEFSRKKTMKSTALTPNKVKLSLNESDILMSMAGENKTESGKADSNLMDISDSAITATAKTSNNGPSIRTRSAVTPARNDCVKRNICEGANRTPTKRFEKSTSYNFSSIKSSPEKEKFDLVYGHLPCTPPKNRSRRPLKRPAAECFDSPNPKAPSAKRKLYKILERPMFYNGIEQLDILTQLKKFEMLDIIEDILGYLPDDGLQAASSVNKSWKAFIDGNHKFRSRRRKFVRTMQTTKENVNISLNQIKPISNNNNNIKALHVHNQNCDIEEKIIAVSPSTQRFYEHQKIVKTLNPEQRILHCPRCNATSVVFPVTGESKVQRRSPRSNKRTGITKVVISEYAVCSKNVCGFEFCTNCNSNRHLNAKCTKRPLGSSPKSDDDTALYRSEYRPKRTLRRLGRLVF